jgi:Tfp pilus assembly protein PilO
MSDVIKKSMQTVNITGAAAVALLVAGSVAFGVVPLYKQGTQKVAEAARLKSELAALDGLSQTLNQVESERKGTEALLTEYEKRLPRSSETNVFIKELATVTKAAGIQVDGTTYPTTLKDAGGYKSLPVQVSGTGDWESCYKFLTGLRQMNRLTRLDSLVLEVDKKEKTAASDRPLCHITVNFSTFFMGR